jgi:hypothetical protein
MFWSNEDALWNILYIVVTLLVSQLPIFSLNVLLVEQDIIIKFDMSVTPLVSHVEMWPYVASVVVESSHHAVRAVRRVAVVNAVARRLVCSRATSRVFVAIPADAITLTLEVDCRAGAW